MHVATRACCSGQTSAGTVPQGLGFRLDHSEPVPGASPFCQVPALSRGDAGGGRAAYRLHGVVHRQEGLQALPLQHVGELHVDRLHGPRVTHDPVLVRVGRVVVARGAGGETCTEVRPGGGRGCWALPPQGPPPSMPREKSSCAGAAAQAETSPLWTLACRGLCPTFGQHLSVCRACTWGDLGVTVPGDRSPPGDCPSRLSPVSTPSASRPMSRSVLGSLLLRICHLPL